MNTQPSGPPPQNSGSVFLSPPVEEGEVGRFGPYRVLKELGRGGMGAVFLAEDTLLKRRVALKVMLPGFAAQDAARARFVREAQAVAALKHDHVVTIYATGEENGVPFFAMELLAGKTLDEWLRPDRRATASQVLTIGRQIAEGLAAAHAAGLVHRDVKPANVWLEAPKGRVKLLDFGLARGSGGGDPGLTNAGDILGTPAYMSPEQARGQPVDHRCDLFALGCVLYRMATGRLPFQGDSAYAVIVAVASETPAAPRAVNPDIPPALEALIVSLLGKDPAARPASAVDVLAGMKRVAAGLTGDTQVLPTERTTSQAAETMEWREPNPAARPSKRVLVAGLAVVALLALVVVLILGKGSSAPPREPDEPAPPPATASVSSKADAETNGKDADPSTLDAEPPKPELSLIGTWEQSGGKISFNFRADGKVTGDFGFKGQWGQSGRKFGFSGKAMKGPELKFKGEIAEDGKTLRMFNPKGGVDTFQRQ